MIGAQPRFLMIGQRRILCLMATQAEYGPELQKRIRPEIIGVGPVEAAIGATHVLSLCQQAGTMPDYVLSLGSAGSASLEQGAIYQAGSVSYRDIDASPLGFEKGRTPFCDHPIEIPLPIRLAGLPVARLSTGGAIISGESYHAIDADMVDMESFAIHRACTRFDVPMIGLRGISDGARELRHYSDWTELLGHIDAELARIIDRLEALLPE